MKKIIAILLAMVLILAAAGCAAAPAEESAAPAEESAAPAEESAAPAEESAAPAEESAAPAEESAAPAEKSEGVMTYEEYAAAAIDDEVVIEAYVQATQSWWEDKITVYTQDQDGAYFIYELACSEEDAAKLVPGTKIKVTGFKAEWSGEVEIVDGTFEFVEGGDTYVAEPKDVTELLGKDELIDYQNQLVSFKGMTVKSIAYKNDKPGEDIYVTVSKDDADYDFCVEMYLTSPESDTYKAVCELKEGDVIDVEGFLYWYEGVNTHITAVSAAE